MNLESVKLLAFQSAVNTEMCFILTKGFTMTAVFLGRNFRTCSIFRMSTAPKRSRFSDKPVEAPSAPSDTSSALATIGTGSSLIKKPDSGPAWKLPESALVPLGGHGKKLSREERRRLRKKKWSEEKVEIPGISTNMPSGLTMEQQMIYMKQLEIEEVSRRLRSNDLGIPGNI